jgi:hypothetical protein
LSLGIICGLLVFSPPFWYVAPKKKSGNPAPSELISISRDRPVSTTEQGKMRVFLFDHKIGSSNAPPSPRQGPAEWVGVGWGWGGVGGKNLFYFVWHSQSMDATLNFTTTLLWFFYPWRDANLDRLLFRQMRWPQRHAARTNRTLDN